MQSAESYIRDQLKFAKEGADNLAKRSGYVWTSWLKGKQGQCTASFDRDGERWSLGFQWTRSEALEVLAERIEQLDWCMRVAMKEFGALKVGAMMAQATEMAVQ
jgi:hypothetical protein